MTKIGVLADLHIGKGTTLTEDRVGEQQAVWQQALNLFADRGCDLVLFAGDATDRRAPDSRERAAFQQPLVGYPIPVVAIPGNHDVQHRDLPTVIDLAGKQLGGGLVIASRDPELIPVAGVVVATLPYAPPSRVRGWCHDHGVDADPDQVAAELLARIVENLRAEAERRYPSVPVVLLGHYPTSGWKVPTGFETSLMRTVVLDVDRIARCGFEQAFLGDIHFGGVIVPGVVSCGSPMPLDFGEAGCEHGCWVHEVGGVPEFVPLTSRPLVTIDLSADAALGYADGFFMEHGFDGAIVRVRYTASEEQARKIDHRALTAALLAAGAHRVAQIIPVVERATRARARQVTGSLTPLAALDAWLADAKVDDVLWPVLRERAATYLQGIA